MHQVTIIGSRETPRDMLELLSSIPKLFPNFLYLSGGAHGADTWGVRYAKNKVIFIPFDGFNKHYHNGITIVNPLKLPTYQIAKAVAAKYHPKWNKLPFKVKQMMTRNVHQVLGLDLRTSTSAIICWTADGVTSVTTEDTGGTGQAIRLASDLGIPVFNFKNEFDYQKAVALLKSIDI